MEHLRHIDATAREICASFHDIGNDKVSLLKRARDRGGDPLAEVDRRVRPGRGKLHHPKVILAEVDIQPPPQFLIKCFAAIYVGNGNDNDL